MGTGRVSKGRPRRRGARPTSSVKDALNYLRQQERSHEEVARLLDAAALGAYLRSRVAYRAEERPRLRRLAAQLEDLKSSLFYFAGYWGALRKHGLGPGDRSRSALSPLVERMHWDCLHLSAAIQALMKAEPQFPGRTPEKAPVGIIVSKADGSAEREFQLPPEEWKGMALFAQYWAERRGYRPLSAMELAAMAVALEVDEPSDCERRALSRWEKRLQVLAPLLREVRGFLLPEVPLGAHERIMQAGSQPEVWKTEGPLSAGNTSAPS